jgi:hypothetical protein
MAQIDPPAFFFDCLDHLAGRKGENWRRAAPFSPTGADEDGEAEHTSAEKSPAALQHIPDVEPEESDRFWGRHSCRESNPLRVIASPECNSDFRIRGRFEWRFIDPSTAAG